MSAQTVTAKIEEKARASAQAIIAEANKKAEKDAKAIIDDAMARVQKMLDSAKQNAEIAEKGRAQADAMTIKLGVLSLKKELLANARNTAKAKLMQMTDAEFTSIFSKYLCESELAGEFELIPSTAHRKLAEKAKPKLEKSANITLKISSKDADVDSGFILSCDDYDVVFSLDAILDDIFEKNEKAIADTLFNTGDTEK